CIHDDRDQVAGVVAVLHDITREKEISQMKNDFVSHVSHELRTPLASITAYAEMLVDGEAQDDATRSEFHSIIQSQAQRLNRLIDDILNISRIESGLVKVNKEPVSMTMLIRDAVQMIKSYAAEKNITINEQTPIIFDQAMADKDMISQVIINLLSNAVKYTPAGGEVHIGTEVDEADGIVRITVTDNGVGIPVADLPHVFDKFYRVAANNKCAKGTGLGLNLVKQIVEKVHDGRVFVTSERGKGSTFGFDLPLRVEQTVGAA
ncbi:MAG: ATP-binding protein, partial [Sedimentisphaerales bacterium]|nr:ATP-binding protein [Sedimentisphaerales bacterium]